MKPIEILEQIRTDIQNYCDGQTTLFENQKAEFVEIFNKNPAQVLSWKNEDVIKAQERFFLSNVILMMWKQADALQVNELSKLTFFQMRLEDVRKTETENVIRGAASINKNFVEQVQLATRAEFIESSFGGGGLERVERGVKMAFKSFEESQPTQVKRRLEKDETRTSDDKNLEIKLSAGWNKITIKTLDNELDFLIYEFKVNGVTGEVEFESCVRKAKLTTRHKKFETMKVEKLGLQGRIIKHATAAAFDLCGLPNDGTIKFGGETDAK